MLYLVCSIYPTKAPGLWPAGYLPVRGEYQYLCVTQQFCLINGAVEDGTKCLFDGRTFFHVLQSIVNTFVVFNVAFDLLKI